MLNIRDAGAEDIPLIFEFYQSLGAQVMQGWLTMRVSGEQLRKLAALAGDSRLRNQE